MATLFNGGEAGGARPPERNLQFHPTQRDGMSTATLEFDGQSAVADRASELRIALGTWLRTHGIGKDKSYDIVLATYEALANTVEHAYRNITGGTVDLHADYRGDIGRIEIVVTDHGTWSIHDDDPTRGRGVPLMRALADTADVQSDQHGTTVRLVWDNHLDSTDPQAG